MKPQKADPGKGEKDPVYGGATAQSLIDFIVDPSHLKEMDFGGVLLRLTDTKDAGNFVEIRISQHVDLNDPRAPAVSYCRVGASCNFAAGWEFGFTGGDGVYHPGRYHNGESGTGIALSFKGVSDPLYGNGIIHSGQILFDYSSYSFYTYPGSLTSNGVFFINDLDNMELYRGIGWTGFTEDKCYLTITPFDFYGSSGRLIIKSIGTHDLTMNEIVDNEAPKININYEGYSASDLPKAKIGTAYPVFSADVIDNLDLNLKSKVSVIYKDSVNNKDINVNMVDGKFIPEKEGQYIIKYEASDYSGNVSTPISLLINTINNVEDIVLSSDITSVNGVVFDEIKLPTVDSIATSGGSGKITVNTKLFDPDKNEVEYSNDAFRPKLIGTYHLLFTGEDYIGNIGQLDIPIIVNGLEKPIFMEDINLPPVLVKDFTYNFPQVKTIDSVDGKIIETPSEIYANGVKVDNNDYVASGDSVVIKYVAKGHNIDTTKEFNIDVINPKDENNRLDQSAFFYGNIANKVVNKDDVSLSFANESYFTFANLLDSENLTVGFETVEGLTNFGNIEFKLVDAVDQRDTLTLSLDVNNKKISLPNGESNFAFIGKEVIFQYVDSSFAILDTNGDQVAFTTINDLGEAFTGFENGVYLTITFKNVTSNSEIKVTQINNQPIGYKNNSGDKIGPSIRLDSTFVSQQYYGEKLSFPSFKAYDVFSQIKEYSIRVTKPNDEIIIMDPVSPQEINIDLYGTYMVMYSASDTRGNPSRISLVIFVYDDVKPQLEVDALNKVQYHVGDVLNIPKYRASDNLGYISVDVILIMPTNEMRLLTHDENGEVTYALIDNSIYNSSFIVNEHSCRLEMKGKYTLRYVAYDKEFNREMVEYTFKAY